MTVKDEWKDRFTLTAEDYLHGLISLVNELVCLASCRYVVHVLYAHLCH